MMIQNTAASGDFFSELYRPAPIALFNTASRALSKFGASQSPIVAAELLRRAKKGTGLSGFGDEFFIEPLNVMVESINREANLSPIGLKIVEGRLLGILTNKLRAQFAFSSHPDILTRPIKAPIVIVGLARTGTTMLHRLIAQDPKIRALAAWESMNPVPQSKSTGGKNDPRIAASIRAAKGMKYISPGFFAIHPVDAHAPEEEVVLLEQAFISTSPESMMHLPTYANWVESNDNTPAYVELRRMLQFLDWQRSAERWILKTPHHLEFLDPLFKVFPDARIIQTHRDPLKALGSCCSMMTHLRAMFSDEVDPHNVGKHWSRKVERMITRAMATRDHVGDDRFVDVSYYDLLKNPIAEVERIYDACGMDLTDDARSKMQASRKANRQHKHAYTLEDFGLNKSDVEPRFSMYRRRFNIPHEDY